MKRKRTSQYTIRAVPAEVDRALRLRARREGRSLNAVALDALRKGAGVEDNGPIHHDLDFLIGSWVESKEFHAALAEFEKIDEALWR